MNGFSHQADAAISRRAIAAFNSAGASVADAARPTAPGGTATMPKQQTIPPGPWNERGEHPVQWALRTGRLGAGDERAFYSYFAADPQTYAQLLPTLTVCFAAAEDPAPGGAAAPPAVLGGSDLPAATASGVEPGALGALPWEARVAAAYEPDRAKVAQILTDYGDGSEQAAAFAAVEFADHPGVRAHKADAEHWRATQPLTDDEVAQLYPPHLRATIRLLIP